MDQNNKTEIKEVFQEIAGLENNKIWMTVKGLTIRPGRLISEYIEGTDSRILNPLTYYLFIFAICSYLGNVSGFNDAVEKEGKEFLFQLAAEYGLPLKGSTMETVERSNRFLDSISTLIILPIYLLLQWAIFRRYKSSFKANAWFNLFTMGHLLLLSAPLEILVWRITGSFIPISIPLLAYVLWATKQFYNLKFLPACFCLSLYCIGGAIIEGGASSISAALFTAIKYFGL